MIERLVAPEKFGAPDQDLTRLEDGDGTAGEAHPQGAANPPVDSSGTISQRVLDPPQRMSEVLFGHIMVLTFTGSLEVATAGKADVRALLVTALGCNLAWAVIDGGMDLMSCLHERGRKAHDTAGRSGRDGWRSRAADDR